jgi:hypothetical protein
MSPNPKIEIEEECKRSLIDHIFEHRAGPHVNGIANERAGGA